MDNTDKPAYPTDLETEWVKKEDEPFPCGENKPLTGLTKFEKVAAMAMQGFAASADDMYGTPQEVAKDGIAAAHAFFNELNEETE